VQGQATARWLLGYEIRVSVLRHGLLRCNQRITVRLVLKELIVMSFGLLYSFIVCISYLDEFYCGRSLSLFCSLECVGIGNRSGSDATIALVTKCESEQPQAPPRFPSLQASCSQESQSASNSSYNRHLMNPRHWGGVRRLLGETRASRAHVRGQGRRRTRCGCVKGAGRDGCLARRNGHEARGVLSRN
jgi:hypothetical protein